MRILITLVAVSLLNTAVAQLPPLGSSPTSESAQRERTSASDIQAENCRVKFINHVQIPAAAEGKLVELGIEEGQSVEKDAVLGIIDDTAAKLALERIKAEELEAELNATNEVNLKDAVNSEELARAEAEAYKELRKQGATPYWEMEKKRLEAERAKLRIDLAEMQMKIEKAKYIAKRNERQMAEHEIERRRITAPFAGYIENRIAQPGEWVQPGSPLAMLVKLDKLRVEGDIHALRYSGRVVAGTPVQIVVYNQADRGQAITIDGRLGFVSSEVDLNDRYRVWVEIDNPRNGNTWMIKPGMEAEITIKAGN